MEEIGAEVERLKVKKELYRKALDADIETADSHMRAMASFIHDIYTGIEKLLEGLVKYFDGQLPAGEDWHRKLLARAAFPNKDVRPAIISGEAILILDELRSFRHVSTDRYLSNLIPKRVDDLAEQTVSAFDIIRNDIARFIDSLGSYEGE